MPYKFVSVIIIIIWWLSSHQIIFFKHPKSLAKKMKIIFSIIFIVFFILPLNFVQAEVIQKETQGFSYSLFLPSSYDSSKDWPLIVALHPSTGRGRMMVDYFKEQAEEAGYIVAGPDSQDSATWYFNETGDILRMISEINQDYSLDTSRVFVTGFSAGAGMSYVVGLNNPDKIRAIAAFAGPFKELEIDRGVFLTRRQRRIPVLILHGSQDHTISIDASKYAKKRLKEFGYEVTFRDLRGVGHEYPDYVSWIIINWFEKLRSQ